VHDQQGNRQNERKEEVLPVYMAEEEKNYSGNQSHDSQYH
jgi:hypothetical protein